MASSTEVRMSSPRRVRVEPGIYARPDGALELGFRDAAGNQRWKVVPETSGWSHGRKGIGIQAARAMLAEAHADRKRGVRPVVNPRLRFGQAADRWLAEQVVELRPATRAAYTSYVENHLRPRWGSLRVDAIDVGDAASLVRELRSQGLAEWTIAGVLRVANRVFKFARRHCGWSGQNPVELLEKSERPRPSETPERRVYSQAELRQMVTAAEEPWRTLFDLAAVVGPRESELLGLWWEDLDLSDPATATVRFTHQVDRHGQRVELKTDESKATLPLPRAAVAMLLAHKARSVHTGPTAFVFAARTTGRPLGQRNVLRALYRAQERARTPEGKPTFPQLFEHDEHGHLVVDDRGQYVLSGVRRRDVDLPDFHALRHMAAMECEDAEEARDLLRHKNSNVTRAVYRAHFADVRRERLRERMEARMEAQDRSSPQAPSTVVTAEVVDLRAGAATVQEAAAVA